MEIIENSNTNFKFLKMFLLVVRTIWTVVSMSPTWSYELLWLIFALPVLIPFWCLWWDRTTKAADRRKGLSGAYSFRRLESFIFRVGTMAAGRKTQHSAVPECFPLEAQPQRDAGGWSPLKSASLPSYIFSNEATSPNTFSVIPSIGSIWA